MTHSRRQKKLLPAISKEQLGILLNHCLSQRDKVTLNLLWYSGMRLSEVASVKAKEFNWNEGTVIVLGKGNHLAVKSVPCYENLRLDFPKLEGGDSFPLPLSYSDNPIIQIRT